MSNLNDWKNGTAPHVCGHWVEDHGPGFTCPDAAFGGGPSKAEIAWSQYEIAVKALVEAERRQRTLTHYANPPIKNQRLAEAVERAQRRVDVASNDLTIVTGYEA